MALRKVVTTIQTEEELFKYYRSIVDFSDKDQKSNFKWIEGFLRHQKKHHPTEDNCRFLSTTIYFHFILFRVREQ